MKTIDQLFHIHPLMFFEATPFDHYDLWCERCSKRVPKFSSCYGCIDCGFYLHKPCAEFKLPTEIQNFFEVNQIQIETIDHFLHIHPLNFSQDYDNVCCYGCGKTIIKSSPSYGCQACKFFLHESCAKLPKEIQTFFHPCPLLLNKSSIYVCDACFRRITGFAYSCRRCDFDMHVECVQRPTIEPQEVEEKLIQPFLHDHPLNFFEVNPIPEPDLDEVTCKGCRARFRKCTPAYGCSECGFYLHKPCAELPREMQNCFHPCPLRLSNNLYGYSCNACFRISTGFAYSCRRCDFDMHVECAQRPTIESEEKLIQHFTHWHPLQLVGPCKELQVGCSIGGNLCCSASDCDSSAYFCSEGCDFFLHNSCIKSIPRQINNHSFHPSCPLILLTTYSDMCSTCYESGSGLTFRCGKCEFQLDVKCALTVDTIQHCAHRHPLVQHESKESDRKARCSACGEYCLLDPFYGCIKQSCDFFLHKKCADELQPKIHHPFHTLHPLTLLRDLSYQCKVCDEDGSGFAYSCIKCKFHLDLKCALFPAMHQSKDADAILHCSHKHPLVALQESKEIGNEVLCRACPKSCLAPCFGCRECNFFLHKTCAVEVQEKEIRHPFHPLHPLTLSSTQPLPDRGTFRCDACLGCDDCFILRYRCAKCDFDLHIDCVKHKHTVPNIKYDGHKHQLSYFDKTFAPVECSICQKNAQTCFFRCLACKFNVHIYCIPATPKTLEHHSHLHPLTVTESPFEYELISSEYDDGLDDHEFYCDVCEEKRYRFESVYYCADCKFIAEVRCVLSELLPSLMIMVEATVVSREEESSAIEATIERLKSKIMKSKGVRWKLNNEANSLRGKLKRVEEKLEQENCKFRELRTDHFLYKYEHGYNKKENERPTDASSSFSSDGPSCSTEPSSDSSASCSTEPSSDSSASCSTEPSSDSSA